MGGFLRRRSPSAPSAPSTPAKHPTQSLRPRIRHPNDFDREAIPKTLRPSTSLSSMKSATFASPRKAPSPPPPVPKLPDNVKSDATRSVMAPLLKEAKIKQPDSAQPQKRSIHKQEIHAPDASATIAARVDARYGGYCPSLYFDEDDEDDDDNDFAVFHTTGGLGVPAADFPHLRKAKLRTSPKAGRMRPCPVVDPNRPDSYYYHDASSSATLSSAFSVSTSSTLVGSTTPQLRSRSRIARGRNKPLPKPPPTIPIPPVPSIPTELISKAPEISAMKALRRAAKVSCATVVDPKSDGVKRPESMHAVFVQEPTPTPAPSRAPSPEPVVKPVVEPTPSHDEEPDPEPKPSPNKLAFRLELTKEERAQRMKGRLAQDTRQKEKADIIASFKQYQAAYDRVLVSKASKDSAPTKPLKVKKGWLSRR